MAADRKDTIFISQLTPSAGQQAAHPKLMCRLLVCGKYFHTHISKKNIILE